MLPALGLAMVGAGIYGSLSQKTPRYDMSGMNEALKLIEKQYQNVQDYFEQAGTAFEEQYKGYYGQQVQDAVSELASRGIFESPVSERAMGRKRQALAETYSSAKSELAGQKLAAESQIDQQRISYLQNLANIQYQQQLAKQQKKGAVFGAIGGIGSALLGMR